MICTRHLTSLAFERPFTSIKIYTRPSVSSTSVTPLISQFGTYIHLNGPIRRIHLSVTTRQKISLSCHHSPSCSPSGSEPTEYFSFNRQVPPPFHGVRQFAGHYPRSNVRRDSSAPSSPQSTEILPKLCASIHLPCRYWLAVLGS